MSEERPPARRPWLVVAASAVVLLLLLGIGWLVTRPVAAPWTDGASSPRRSTGTAGTIGGDAADTRAQVAHGTDTPARQAADVGGAMPPIALRILDVDRRPVAGATVRIDPNAEQIAFFDLQDAEPLLAAIAAQTSDDDGLVHAQLPRGVAMVTARKGDAYVQAWIDIADAIADPIELQVLDDRELVVQTRLADGTVAPHVPVELAYSWDRNVALERLDRHVFARTDANGELVVRHAQRLFRRTPPAPQLLLRPFVVGVEAAATTVSLDAVRARVELACAPHGAIRGTSFGRDGQPIVALTGPVVKLQHGDGEPRRVAVPAWPQARSGEWFLHPLVLGARWRFEGEPYESLEVVGPRHQGEIVEVQQRRQRTVGRLRLTLQAPDGSVIADEPVRIDSDVREIAVVRTDHRGGIDVVRRSGERSIRVEATDRHAWGDLPIPAGAAAMPASLDAGVLRLEPQQLLVQGVVVDASSGVPVRATLEAYDRDAVSGALARAHTAADGSFELWGHTSAPLLVRANASRRRELDCELQPGARDVVLCLASVRQLFVTLLFDDDIDDEELETHLEPGGSWSAYRSDVGYRHQALPLPDGGDAALVVATAGHVLVRVPAAAWQHGPRGAAVTVDLRGRLATFTVAATRGGEPVEAKFRLLAGTAEDRAAEWVRPGTALVLTTDRPWRVLVVPETGGTLDVPLQRGHNVVEVPGPARVRGSCGNEVGDLGGAHITFELLRLRDDEPLLARSDDGDPPPPLPTTIDALRDDGRNVTRQCRPAGEAQPGQFWIGHRGRYALFAVLEQGAQAVLLAQTAVEFDVAAFDCELPIVVPLQPSALAAARQQLAHAESPR